MNQRDNDPIYDGLITDIVNVGDRLASHLEATTGVRRSVDDLIAMVLEDVTRQRNERTLAAPEAVASLSRHRLARGLQAVVRPDVVEELTFSNVPMRGGQAFLRDLAVRLHGEATERNIMRVLQAALERGLTSLKREANQEP